MDISLFFDEDKDAVFGLEFVRELLQKVPENSQYWKWVFIALHNSLQGFMVLALIHPDRPDVLSERGIRRQRHKESWIRISRDPSATTLPRFPDLADFMELYGSIKRDDLMGKLAGGRPFQATEKQDQSVRDLHEIRNEFEHFRPRIWVDDAREFIDIVDDSLQVISFLVLDSRKVFLTPQTLKDRACDLIREVQNELMSLKRMCELKAHINRAGI